MIHIIDPRTQTPLPDLFIVGSPMNSWETKRQSQRYLADRNLHCADLVAVRESTGLYSILKWRYDTPPSHPVRRKTLDRYIAESLDAHNKEDTFEGLSQ